jgi:hypothetical protein
MFSWERMMMGSEGSPGNSMFGNPAATDEPGLIRSCGHTHAREANIIDFYAVCKRFDMFLALKAKPQ